jgi:hypothetical protein
VHDIVDLEGRGTPGVLVASLEFVDAVASQATALGFPDVARVFVDHPIQDRTDAELEALADGAVGAVLAALCPDWRVPDVL